MAVGGSQAGRLQLLGRLIGVRVLGLVHQYIPARSAGAETHIHAMLRALAGQGHRVDVVLSAQPGDPYHLDGVNVWPTTDRRKDPFRWLADADVLVAHLDNTERAMALGEWNDKPVVLVQHNTFNQAKEVLSMPAMRVDLVAVNSEWMAEDLRVWFAQRGETPPASIIVRPAIIDPAEYSTDPGDKVTLINLRRQDHDSGRDGLTKGGELFRAVAERMPDIGFLGVTGIYGRQQELDDLANVEVLPHVPHDRVVADVYARTRLLLVPSSYESWGRVAGEAMCSGIPVIANPTPGLLEQLDDAGRFADYRDVDLWVHEIRAALEPHAWRLLSALAKRRAHQLAEVGRADLDRWCLAVERVAAAHHAMMVS